MALYKCCIIIIIIIIINLLLTLADINTDIFGRLSGLRAHGEG